MQKKLLLILFIFVSSFTFSSCSITNDSLSKTPSTILDISTPVSMEKNTLQTPIATDFTARFEIFTNSTRRVFTETKYHNQSADVYIEKIDPHLIYIKKSNTTWNDFFSTLPFSITKDCLVTGTKQTFCSTETKKLYFYLNDQEAPDALDRPISPNDSLIIEYDFITK